MTARFIVGDVLDVLATLPDDSVDLVLTWTDCECGAPWRPGVVLDPFAGTGTTLAAAVAHGRTAIGIDLDERNVDLARQRVGMWLTAEHHTREAAS